MPFIELTEKELNAIINGEEVDKTIFAYDRFPKIG